MNQATGHLTDAQIESYVNQDAAASNPGEKRLWLEAHLADCESCVGRVLHAERKHLGLLEGDHMRKTPYPGCPAEEILQELAAGIGSPEIAEATTEHAAHCDFCGPVLNRYLKEFSESVEQEDAAILKNLETSKTGWQKKFVRENFAVAKRESKWALFSGFWPKLVTATALVAVAVGIYFVVRPSDDLRQAQKLVASAYSERRTIEMRFPSAPFASFNPVPVVKGSTDVSDWRSAPAQLVQAEAILKEKSTLGELSPSWLQVEGRIDLLQGNSRSVDAAVEAFEKALAKNPENLGLKLDLATAYFEREMRADPDRPVLIKTIDLLTDVVKNSNADDTLRRAALFNLAVAYEKSEMRDLAVATWEQYLQLDSTSDWAKEAGARLNKLKKEMPLPRQQGYRQPAYFLQHFDSARIQEDL